MQHHSSFSKSCETSLVYNPPEPFGLKRYVVVYVDPRGATPPKNALWSTHFQRCQTVAQGPYWENFLFGPSVTRKIERDILLVRSRDYYMVLPNIFTVAPFCHPGINIAYKALRGNSVSSISQSQLVARYIFKALAEP